MCSILLFADSKESSQLFSKCLHVTTSLEDGDGSWEQTVHIYDHDTPFDSLKLMVIADSWWDFQISSWSENTVWHTFIDADLPESQTGAEKSQSIHKNPSVR